MANCGLLLNDGSSFILKNAGGVLLLNDNSCGTEAGVSEAALAGTGTGTASFGGAFNVLSSAVLAATGTGVASFQGFPPAGAATAADVGGAGTYAKAWKDHWEAKRRRDLQTIIALDRIRSSQEYKRLKRKLEMLREHLADKPAWYVENEIKEKIELIEAQIEKMEATAVH